MPNGSKRRSPSLAMFFYGTLKRGQPNYARFCQGALRVERASVRGRLYRLPQGYPALVAPRSDVRLLGSADPLRDALEQRRLNEAQVRLPGGSSVCGELFFFDDAGSLLPVLDAFEGFDPTGPSLYLRALIPALAESGTLLAWTYLMTETPPGNSLPEGRWTE
ncbi:MAG: gamma-glutamylcyclotransferase family protein [Actinomycetota bacterium]